VIDTIADWFRSTFGVGVDAENVGVLQMALRTLVVYIFTLIIVRLGSKRFLGKHSSFDVIVGIMMGSVMSRAINSQAPFVPTLAAGAMMIALHWLLGWIAVHTDWLGPLIKGEPVLLIRDGQLQREGMHKALLTTQDLMEALRLQGYADPDSVHLAYLERDGTVSVVPYRKTHP